MRNLLPVIFGTLAVAGVGLAAGSAAGQDERAYRPPVEPEAIIYRDPGYNGPAVSVRNARPNMGLAWRVASIRVKSGTWQLCEQPNFRGRCTTYTVDTPAMSLATRGVVVQSARPLGWAPPPGAIPGPNPNLRGQVSQYFVAPAANGYRVRACLTGSANSRCVARSADRFCKQNGWRHSVFEHKQTIGGIAYLSDVLCAS